MENELFERAPIPKAYFKMALPVVFSMVVSLVYNMVDTFFIARTQNADLVAGVSLCAPVFCLMIALGDIFGLGGSSVISRLFGEQKDPEGKRVSGFCFYASMLTGVAVAAAMLLLKSPILRLLGASEGTFGYASDYYFYLALGAPFIIVSLTPSNLVRTEGLATQSMVATVTGSIVNILLDPLFIFGLNMGAGGAAIATVLGNVASDLLLVRVVRKKSKKLTVSPRDIRIGGREIRAILAIGIPASVTNLMQSFCTMMLNRSLASYGSGQIAAMGIAQKVNNVVALVMVGFAFGAQPLLGYSYGARNEKRLRSLLRFDLLVEIGFSAVTASALALFAPQIVKLFMQDPDIVSAGSRMLRCLLLSTPLVGVILVFTTLFQSQGKALPALALSISRQGVLFVLCLALLGRLAGYSGILLAPAAADALTAALAVVLYRALKRHETDR